MWLSSLSSELDDEGVNRIRARRPVALHRNALGHGVSGSEPFCTVFREAISESIYGYREPFGRQTKRPTDILRWTLPRQSASQVIAGVSIVGNSAIEGRLPVGGHLASGSALEGTPPRGGG